LIFSDITHLKQLPEIGGIEEALFAKVFYCTSQVNVDELHQGMMISTISLVVAISWKIPVTLIPMVEVDNGFTINIQTMKSISVI
jgi:hypothetical protein